MLNDSSEWKEIIRFLLLRGMRIANISDRGFQANGFLSLYGCSINSFVHHEYAKRRAVEPHTDVWLDCPQVDVHLKKWPEIELKYWCHDTSAEQKPNEHTAMEVVFSKEYTVRLCS